MTDLRSTSLRGLRAAVALVALMPALALVACASGASSPATARPSATVPVATTKAPTATAASASITPAASTPGATPTPSATPTAGAASPGITALSDPDMLLESGSATVQGDLVEIAFVVQAWPPAAGAGRVNYNVYLQPHGYESSVPPLQLTLLPPGLVDPPPPQLRFTNADGAHVTIPAKVAYDAPARIVRAAFRVAAGWPPIARVLVSALQLGTTPGKIEGAGNMRVLVPQAGTVDLGSDLPSVASVALAPPSTPARGPYARVTTTRVPGGQRLRTGDLPVAITVPSAWSASAELPAGTLEAQNPAADEDVGVRRLDMGSDVTPAEVLTRIVDESGGAYVRAGDAGAPPAGIDAIMRVDAARDYFVYSAPGQVLENWQSVAGNHLLLGVTRRNGVLYLAYVEVTSEHPASVLATLFAGIAFD